MESDNTRSIIIPPANLIEAELANFVSNVGQTENQTTILLFPCDVLSPIITKYIRYQAAIYNLAAVYVQDNNCKALAVCHKQQLRYFYEEDSEDEDSELISVDQLKKSATLDLTWKDKKGKMDEVNVSSGPLQELDTTASRSHVTEPKVKNSEAEQLEDRAAKNTEYQFQGQHDDTEHSVPRESTSANASLDELHKKKSHKVTKSSDSDSIKLDSPEGESQNQANNSDAANIDLNAAALDIDNSILPVIEENAPILLPASGNGFGFSNSTSVNNNNLEAESEISFLLNYPQSPSIHSSEFYDHHLNNDMNGDFYNNGSTHDLQSNPSDLSDLQQTYTVSTATNMDIISDDRITYIIEDGNYTYKTAISDCSTLDTNTVNTEVNVVDTLDSNQQADNTDIANADLQTYPVTTEVNVVDTLDSDQQADNTDVANADLQTYPVSTEVNVDTLDSNQQADNTDVANADLQTYPVSTEVNVDTLDSDQQADCTDVANADLQTYPVNTEVNVVDTLDSNQQADNTDVANGDLQTYPVTTEVNVVDTLDSDQQADNTDVANADLQTYPVSTEVNVDTLDSNQQADNTDVANADLQTYPVSTEVNVDTLDSDQQADCTDVANADLQTYPVNTEVNVVDTLDSNQQADNTDVANGDLQTYPVSTEVNVDTLDANQQADNTDVANADLQTYPVTTEVNVVDTLDSNQQADNTDVANADLQTYPVTTEVNVDTLDSNQQADCTDVANADLQTYPVTTEVNVVDTLDSNQQADNTDVANGDLQTYPVSTEGDVVFNDEYHSDSINNDLQSELRQEESNLLNLQPNEQVVAIAQTESDLKVEENILISDVNLASNTEDGFELESEADSTNSQQNIADNTDNQNIAQNNSKISNKDGLKQQQDNDVPCIVNRYESVSASDTCDDIASIEEDNLSLCSSNSKIETPRSTDLIIINDNNQPQTYNNNNTADMSSSTARSSTLELDSDISGSFYDQANNYPASSAFIPYPQVLTPPTTYAYPDLQVLLTRDIAQAAVHRPVQAVYRNIYGEDIVYEVVGNSAIAVPSGLNITYIRSSNNVRGGFNVNAQPPPRRHYTLNANALEFIMPNTRSNSRQSSPQNKCTNETSDNTLNAVQTLQNNQTQYANGQTTQNLNNSMENSQVKELDIDFSGLQFTSLENNKKTGSQKKHTGAISKRHAQPPRAPHRIWPHGIPVKNPLETLAGVTFLKKCLKSRKEIADSNNQQMSNTSGSLVLYGQQKIAPTTSKEQSDHSSTTDINETNTIVAKESVEDNASTFNQQDSSRKTIVSNGEEPVSEDHKNLINQVKQYFVGNTDFILAEETYDQYQNETFLKMEHAIELFNIPRSYITQDLLNIYKEGPRYIKWYDDNHALLIMGSAEQATRALSICHYIVQSRPMSEASPIANLVAFTLFTAMKRQMKRSRKKNTNKRSSGSCVSVTTSTSSTDDYSSRGDQAIEEAPLLRDLQALQAKKDANTVGDGQSKDSAKASSSENMQTEATEIATNNKDCNTTAFTETTDPVIRCVPNESISGNENVNISKWNDIFAKNTTLIKKVNKIFKKNATVIIATQNYDQYQGEMFQKMGHLIELFNIPEAYEEEDLLNVYEEEPRYIVWCDDTTALLVTGSFEQAQRAVLVNHEIIKSRAMEIASLLAIAVACEFVLLPASKKSSNKTQSDSDKVRRVGKKNVRKILQLTEDDTTSTISSRSDYDAQIKYAVNKPRNNAREEATFIGYGNIVALKSSLTQLVKQYFKNPATVVFPMGDCTPYQNQMEHVIELYNIPPQYSTPDVSAVYREQPSYIKWCDNTHALLVTSSAEQANRALLVKHASIKSRRMIDASPISTIVACKSKLHLAVDNQSGLDIEEQLEKSNPEVECTSVRKLDVQTVDLSKNSEELPQQIEQEHHENTEFQPTDSNGEEVMASVAATENAEESADIAWEANGSHKEWTFNAD